MYKKLPLFLLVPLLACGAGAVPSVETGWLTSVDEALDQAAEHDRYILVDLYADWCGWCKTLEEEVFSTGDFREFTSDFVLLRVDVDDGADGSALQARFGIYNLPTMLIMDKEQVQVGTVTGYAPTPEYLQKLSDALASYRTFLEYYDKMRASDDLGLLYQLAEQLSSRQDGARAAPVFEKILRQTGEASPQAALLHFLIADAHRMAGRFDDAMVVQGRARALARGAEPRDLMERIDLLSYNIAQDSRDCEEAESHLVHFLEKHPRSEYRRGAEQALRALRNGQSPGCA